MRTTISVCIAVFNNSESIRILVEDLIKKFDEGLPSFSLEIVLVDDGSTDSSWDAITSMQNKYPHTISAHKLTRNFGQLSAMLVSYQQSHGDAIVSISADLQDPVEIIPEMVERWNQGSEIVLANRVGREDGKLASISSKFAYFIARRSIPNLPIGGFDYFLMSRKTVDLLLGFEGRYRFLQGDLLWLGLPMSFIPYVRLKRKYGKSGYTFFKRFGNFMDLLLDSSIGPIKFISWIGFIFSLLFFFYSLSIIHAAATGGTPFKGWAPIMVVILFSNGVIMLSLGIIGAYLWRIYDQNRKRPSHIILESRKLHSQK